MGVNGRLCILRKSRDEMRYFAMSCIPDGLKCDSFPDRRTSATSAFGYL